MSIEIKHISGKVLFTSDRASVRDAIEEAREKGADLGGADLRGADLYAAYLYGADLRGADLYGADLSGADLRGVDLRGADLSGAYLRGVDLRGVDLYGADLRGADLRGADLYGAYLSDADLSGAKNADLAIARTRILPDGDLIGWKKSKEGHIVKLRIPADARRTHGVGRKCRAERAEVVAIYAGSDEVATAQSCFDPKFQYAAGAVVTPREPFNDDMWKECASGIHFYITRLEAEAHT